MRLKSIIPFFVIVWVIMIVFFIVEGKNGCGCSSVTIPNHPIFTIERVNDSTGPCVNLTYANPNGVKEVKDLRLWSGYAGGDRPSPAVNTTLVSGESYLLKVNDTGPEHIAVVVNADGYDVIVADTTI